MLDDIWVDYSQRVEESDRRFIPGDRSLRILNQRLDQLWIQKPTDISMKHTFILRETHGIGPKAMNHLKKVLKNNWITLTESPGYSSSLEDE